MTETLTHFSLFTGIGGIDLAAEWAGFETIGQCEFADYPTKVLEKHWPEVARWRDVRDVTAESFRERTGRENPTLLSGGFPCQPHSLAGKRLASGDERDLWGEFARCIRVLKPRWVLGENVRGLLSSEDGRFFGRILRDLAQLGYTAGWACFPAAWVGTIHRRERIFIVAHADSERFSRQPRHEANEPKRKDCNEKRYVGWEKAQADIVRYIQCPETAPADLRNNYGLPGWMDRIRALGNAVVPQQVFPVLESIAWAETHHRKGRRHEPSTTKQQNG